MQAVSGQLITVLPHTTHHKREIFVHVLVRDPDFASLVVGLVSHPANENKPSVPASHPYPAIAANLHGGGRRLGLLQGARNKLTLRRPSSMTTAKLHSCWWLVHDKEYTTEIGRVPRVSLVGWVGSF